MPQYELNLRDYWQIIQKRRFVLIVTFLLVLVITVIYTGMQQPIYQAVAGIQWQERRTAIGLLTELVYHRMGEPLVAQAQIITSLPVLEEVAIELGLVRRDSSADEIMTQVSIMQGSISTDIIERSNVIQIIVNHENPQMAANIANKVAEVYIAENLKEKSKLSRTVREFIEKQLGDISTKLKNSEEALVRFKEVEIPSGIALVLQDRLANLEIERQNLLRQYTVQHPNVKDVEAQINEVKEQFKTLPQKELEYSRLGREVDINAKLYLDLKGKLEGARITEAENIADVTFVAPAATPMSPVAPRKSLNYFLGATIGLMLGLTSVFIFEQLDTSIGTIEDVEGFLKLPVLGVIPYLRTAGEKETFIKKLWPKEYKGKEKILHLRKQLLIYYPSRSTVSEVYLMLRTNIQNEVFKEKIQGKILLLSSSGPEEGKSITVSNLAIVMAQGGLHTLLIDADMRRSAIHKLFGLKNKEPGLSDILSGGSNPEESIRKFTDITWGELGLDEALKMPGLDNLNILTSGSLPAMPVGLLASAEMSNLLQQLRQKFDLILIDTPPVLAVADVTILASKVDGVILVYRVGTTARTLLARTKTELIASGAQVKGIVLNNISSDIELRYGYHYHYKYYGKYYTSEGKKETENKITP